MPFTDRQHTHNIQNFKQKQHVGGNKTVPNAIQFIAYSIFMVATVGLLGACSSKPPRSSGGVISQPAPAPAPHPTPVAAPVPAPAPAAAAPAGLPPMANWADYRRRAAHLIIANNPGASFTGPQPQQWKGIATVTVMLNADGSVRAIDLMRASRISPNVNTLAIEAVRRTGNFGPVVNLPQPWQFNETFLYNDEDKFQLVTIVEGR